MSPKCLTPLSNLDILHHIHAYNTIFTKTIKYSQRIQLIPMNDRFLQARIVLRIVLLVKTNETNKSTRSGEKTKFWGGPPWRLKIIEIGAPTLHPFFHSDMDLN